MEKKTTKLLVNGGYPLHTFDDVEEIYMLYISSKSDREQIRKAYDFMMEKHNNQFRKSGEPYYHHLIEVSYIVASLHAGPATIIASLLHDVVEDTDTTIEDIQKIWGKDVANLVDSLTKIQRLKLSKIKTEEFEAEDHRKILIGMARDIRVIIIKLADRLHNLRTLSSLSTERQLALSKETMEVFVPIASRLGLEVVKTEMEDLCLKYLEREKYDEILKLYKNKTKVLNKSLESIKKRIADTLFEHNIPFEISSRVKSVNSIYEKMYIKGKTFDQIYDILALRIITDTEIQCYEILGLVHQMYKPISGRFKDYIAMPKSNMYQSLHTTIMSGDGNLYEIQIRTKEMDEIAETGIAAHWSYKEGTGYNPTQEQKEIEDKLHWFRDFVSISSDNSSNTANEYMSNLTHDIFEANVYVFTPKGKVVELPAGSTPVDFAFRVHTKVGESCVGALVNATMVPLNTVLKSGDMVEIKTNKNSPGPSEGWLDFVVSTQAKDHIKKFLAKKNAETLKADKIAKAKQSCIDAFKERKVDEEEMIKLLSDPKLLSDFESPTLDDLFLKMFSRNPTTTALLDYLHIKKPVETIVQNVQKNNKSHVYCKGIDQIAISLASCCSPIPGDDIVGYITKGKGITVHRKSCPNILNEKERLVDVYWRNDIEYAAYEVDISIEANDRPNLLNDIMTKLSTNKVPVNQIHAKYINNNSTVLVSATIVVSDVKRLTDIINIISNVTNVIKVNRVIH